MLLYIPAEEKAWPENMTAQMMDRLTDKGVIRKCDKSIQLKARAFPIHWSRYQMKPFVFNVLGRVKVGVQIASD